MKSTYIQRYACRLLKYFEHIDLAFALPSTRLQLESMASKKGEQVPWLRWCLFQRLIKPSWLRMCVMSFQVQLNLRHPIGTEAPPISQRLGVPRCWSCHRLTKFAVHPGPFVSLHHHSWQLSKIPHIHFCLPMFWSLCSNMKVSLTLTSSTLVLRQNLPG